ncbi:MAG: flippase-like domain-containing protein [Elusimicrobiota bacterium]|jgi:uncharacterized protein (TIRG00374 family)|nr:flippase-like domain-containing protein [Elusimicrobiota bacterium]
MKFISKKNIIVILTCLLSVSVVGWLLYDSWANIIKIWEEVNTCYLVLACISSGAIYVCMGMSLWETLKLLGQKINIGAAISIAFVSTTVNYLVSSMGVSGFALRAHLLGKRKIPLGISVMSSIVISVLLYFVLIIIILQGTLLLLFSSNATPGQMVRNFFVVIIIAIIGALITAFMFNSELRYMGIRKIFLLINKVIYKLFGKLIPKNNYSAFDKQLDNGIKTIHKNKAKLTRAIIYICGDWIFTILILYLAFLAVGVKIQIGVLLAGFAIGMVTTLIPILPGGLGAMEIAMTSVFSQMGINWDAALMASLIYRVVYYIIPGIISVFVYWGLKLSEPLAMTTDKAGEYIKNEAKSE